MPSVSDLWPSRNAQLFSSPEIRVMNQLNEYYPESIVEPRTFLMRRIPPMNPRHCVPAFMMQLG